MTFVRPQAEDVGRSHARRPHIPIESGAALCVERCSQFCAQHRKTLEGRLVGSWQVRGRGPRRDGRSSRVRWRLKVWSRAIERLATMSQVVCLLLARLSALPSIRPVSRFTRRRRLLLAVSLSSLLLI